MTADLPITFAVSDVVPATEPLPEVPYQQAVEHLLASVEKGPRVEACSRSAAPLFPCSYHPFVCGLATAFNLHYPICLAPDMIWLLILQGFAQHVNAHAEELRPRLVRHQGKVRIIVYNTFTKGNPDNPWPEALADFSRQIREHIGADTHDLLVPRFSTTGPAERAAAEVTLLDTLQSYFEYVNVFICGIPEITLEGTADDWQALADRAEGLAAFGLADWVALLRPVLRQFVAAARGQVERPFWQSICSNKSTSGTDVISGWVNVFFPYVRDRDKGGVQRNPWLAQTGAALQAFLYPPEEVVLHPWRLEGGATRIDDFPSGLAKAPFQWVIMDKTYPMEFLGGFIGAAQDPQTFRLRPEIGWAVRDAPGG